MNYIYRTVKVIVVANPANTNALVASKVATSIPSKNFSCLTRLDEERLKNFISSKIKEDGLSTVTSNDISNVFIFGNHSATQVPITESGLVSLGECYKTLNDFIDQDWVSSSLSTMVFNPTIHSFFFNILKIVLLYYLPSNIYNRFNNEVQQ
jgi:malate/lactate dehydrogenase